ncbi:MAG: glycerol-3-phosphate dehydrogenase [Pseudomonadota bacterium]
MTPDFDLFVIGGGINGCGIARDAAGRGFSVGLAEMKDLGAATSSSSTKLFHGGLRYLEYLEFRLVREALVEREVLLQAMPHIAWPMRFILPYHKDMRFEATTPVSKFLRLAMPWLKGRRPAWLIRLALLIYDTLGGRALLPGTKYVDLRVSPEGQPLKSDFTDAYEYSDCWVEDARLVVLNARDAEALGAVIMPRVKVISATVSAGVWHLTLEDIGRGKTHHVTARMIVNAAGPWVSDVQSATLKSNHRQSIRLVRGSHIVTKRLFDHEKCYFFQGRDGRIVFAIPYEGDFTLIGTTDVAHENAEDQAECTAEERDYLLSFANEYFETPINADDIVWTYSGVRPLYDDGAQSATAATRDYVLKVDHGSGAPALTVFGGKITTYRRLAESALASIQQIMPEGTGPWTAKAPLPGGDFRIYEFEALVQSLRRQYAFLDQAWATRLVRAYGTEAREVLADARDVPSLGKNFGATLTESEVTWLMDREFAQKAEDIVWRRSKLGLRMSIEQITALDDWMNNRLRSAAAAE